MASRRVRARERADVERAAEARRVRVRSVLPPPNPPCLAAAMLRALSLRAHWESFHDAAKDTAMFIGCAQGCYERVQYGVIFPWQDLLNDPEVVRAGLINADNRLMDEIHHQQAVKDAMEEMEREGWVGGLPRRPSRDASWTPWTPW